MATIGTVDVALSAYMPELHLHMMLCTHNWFATPSDMHAKTYSSPAANNHKGCYTAVPVDVLVTLA
jgi:hypothetical protein